MFEGLTKVRIQEALASACALFPPCGDPAWQGLREADRKEILRLYAEYHAKPYPLRLATGFMEFVRSGSRQADERPYFDWTGNALYYFGKV